MKINDKHKEIIEDVFSIERFKEMAKYARTLKKENQELIEQIKILISPNHLGDAAFKKIVTKAFWEGSNDAKIEGKPYVNP